MNSARPAEFLPLPSPAISATTPRLRWQSKAPATPPVDKSRTPRCTPSGPACPTQSSSRPRRPSPVVSTAPPSSPHTPLIIRCFASPRSPRCPSACSSHSRARPRPIRSRSPLPRSVRAFPAPSRTIQSLALAEPERSPRRWSRRAARPRATCTLQCARSQIRHPSASSRSMRQLHASHGCR